MQREHSGSSCTKTYLAKIKNIHTATEGAVMAAGPQDHLQHSKDMPSDRTSKCSCLQRRGYQESCLDQEARSKVGAIGVMQGHAEDCKLPRRGRHPQKREQCARWRDRMPGPMDVDFKGVPLRRTEPLSHLPSPPTMLVLVLSSPYPARQTRGNSIRMSGSYMFCKRAAGGAGRPGTGARIDKHLISMIVAYRAESEDVEAETKAVIGTSRARPPYLGRLAAYRADERHGGGGTQPIAWLRLRLTNFRTAVPVPVAQSLGRCKIRCESEHLGRAR